MAVNLRRNPWTGADESVRIIGESFTVPTGSTVRSGAPENELKLAEVPRKDPETSVRIYAPGSTTQVNLTDFAQIYEGNPTTNYGSQSYGQTGRDGTGLHYRYRTLAKPNTLAGLPTLVDEVLLRIFLTATGSATYPNERTIGVHAVEETWAEGSVNWSNAPSYNLVAAAKFDVTLTGWYDVVITDLYQQWISSGNNFGLLLADFNDPDTDTMRQFSSDDGANVPKLVIAEPGDLWGVVEANTSPGPGQVAVNYDLGLIRFHDDDQGESLAADYWGTGSLIWA